MAVGFRTLIRGFLLVGGLVFALQGAISGSLFDLGLGLVAALLGGVGLWWELRGGSDPDESVDNI
jgi:hypothetical protein